MRGTGTPPDGRASTTRRKVVVSLAALALIALVAVLGRASAGQRSWQPSATPAGESEAADVPGGQAGSELSGRKTLDRSLLQRAAAQAEAVPSAGGSWEYVGANNIGGRVTDVVVDTTHPNTIFVASAGGGVWKSTDAGATYTPAWPNDYPQAIGSLARGSDGTLWAGTGEANASGGGITYVGDGVYKSTDDGVTWTNVGLGNAGMIGRIAVDPADPNVVLVAASGSIYSTGGKRGLYRTIDGGDALGADPDARPQRGAVHRRRRRGDRPGQPEPRLRDASGTTTAPLPAAVRRHRLRPLRHRQRAGDAGRERDVGADRQLARLRPAAELRRVRLRLNSDPSLGRMGVAIAPSDHTRVYLITGESLGNDKGFFVSDNGDRALADGGPTFVAGGHAGGNPRFEWWFGRLFVDPVNKDHLFKMDVSLRVSTNGGTTWANVGGPHADQHAMAWDPNVPNRVYLGDDGGMYRSDDQRRQRLDARHEHAVAPGLPRRRLAAAAEPDRDRAPGQRLERARYNGPGDVADPVATNWNALPSGGDGHYVVIDQQDDTYTYSCSQNAGCSGRARRQPRRPRRSRRRRRSARRTSSSRASPASSSATRSRSTRRARTRRP